MEKQHITQQYNKIEQLLEWNRYKEAMQECEELVGLDPENPDAYALLANIYFQQDEYDKAMHWAQEAMRRNPEHETAWRIMVNIYYSREDWKSFRESALEAKRISPYDAHYDFLLGNMYNKQGKFDESKDHLQRALSLHPRHSLYLATYGYTLAILHEDEASLECEKQALQSNPENAYVFLYLAWAADKRNDHRTALEFLENAVRLQPADEQIRKEYLEGLQKQYWFYRVLLFPNHLRKLKPWHILVIWIAAWLLFKPLIVLFIVLYIANYWISKLLVHVKVFGWTLPGRK